MPGPPAWNLLNPSNAGPGARDAMLGVFDALRDRMIVFGGYNGGSAVNDVYALNLGGGTAMWSRLQPFGGPPSPRDLTAGVYDPLADRLVMYGGNAKSGPTGTLLGVADLWTLTWGDQPTPTRLAFADERTEPGSVRLTWFTPDGGGQRAVAQRSTDGATWEDVAQLTSDASGEFVLDDAVPTGGRFDYRLGVALPDGEQFTDGHWVVIPVGVAFGFTSVGPNPSRGALRVAFALAAPGAAWLGLYGVCGPPVAQPDHVPLCV